MIEIIMIAMAILIGLVMAFIFTCIILELVFGMKVTIEKRKDYSYGEHE